MEPKRCSEKPSHLYGGSNIGDRNLYVVGATAGGAAVTGAASSLLSSGTNHFTALFTGV